MGDGLPPDLVQLRSTLPIRALVLGRDVLYFSRVVTGVYQVRTIILQVSVFNLKSVLVGRNHLLPRAWPMLVQHVSVRVF